ncbi:YezD family protein [Methylomagnum sp.]
MTSEGRPPLANPDPASVTKKILEALRGLRFGSVEITVHEGRIVQIERKEKSRLNVVCPGAADGEETDR